MNKHFNSSLSQNCTSVTCKTIIKWRIRAHFKITMTNGGEPHGYKQRIIRRVDIMLVHDYARINCCRRDYLIIRVFVKTGLRTSELCTLRIEHIDFNTYCFQVVDSKKHKFCPYPLPLDVETVELIKQFIADRVEGYVFTHQTWGRARADKPLTKQTIWALVRRIGKAAGVEGLKPRHFREAFAAEWYYCASESERDLPELQRYLRHKKPGTTLDYVNSMVLQENVDAAYRRRLDPVAKSFASGCLHKNKKEMVEGEAV